VSLNTTGDVIGLDGKKWMVLAKKGDKYKIVHGGYKGMQDYTQHRNKKRQKNFWNRMGGRNSGKATDPFSPLYWHKRFGTWQDGGNTNNNLNTKTRNIVVLRFPSKFKLTQTQLKLFFKKYGNVMSKLSRNILAGSNRKGFTNLNAYFLGFPSRGA
ncbi:hypothetical protein EBT25_05660, partial [bacterium]|nr:hypothetical protein [bacterium]